MKLIKYYIVRIKHNQSNPYLEEGKRLEYDTPQEARAKIKELESKMPCSMFAWRREQIEV